MPQRTPATDTISYAGYRFPPDVISHAVWLYYRFPLSLRMVENWLGQQRTSWERSFDQLDDYLTEQRENPDEGVQRQ